MNDDKELIDRGTYYEIKDYEPIVNRDENGNVVSVIHCPYIPKSLYDKQIKETEMNERVKILWSEAAESTIGDSWEEQTKFMERFAQLIVRECTGIVTDAVDHCEPASTYADKIKRHFGVEE
jgi:hypothetical protein